VRVIVAIDNKPSSQAIIDALLKMHWFAGSEIKLVSVIPPDSNPKSKHNDHACVEDCNSLMAELKAALRECEISFVIRQGDAKTEILNLAKETEAHLIVLGSNCKNTMERLLLGSVCQAVINDAPCPVIVAKTPCCLAREISPAFRNILIPIDNSIYSDAGIAWLANFDWAASTQFVLAALVEATTDMNLVETSLNEKAIELSRRLKTNNVTTVTSDGKGSQSITDLATACYSDLIVMSGHNRKGLKGLILPELANEVSHKAPCAVAIVEGLVNKEGSWVQEEAFPKIKPEPTAASRNIFTDNDNHDMTINVMPGGF
jgi:nucleotide-binding universal stress UspA family protein